MYSILNTELGSRSRGVSCWLSGFWLVGFDWGRRLFGLVCLSNECHLALLYLDFPIHFYLPSLLRMSFCQGKDYI